LSCPFALYEALTKRAGVAELKVKLDLKADQLVAVIVTEIEEVLLPHWPRSVTVIFIEPSMSTYTNPALSEAARDALTSCVAKSMIQHQRLATVKKLAHRILRFDRVLYWLIFVTAAVSLGDLLIWAFKNGSSDFLLLCEILGPAGLIASSLVVAGVRQSFLQFAERQIIEE
jgi:hypothetical protein